MRRLVPLLVAVGALVAAAEAHAYAIPRTEAVEDAAMSADDRPRFAFVRGRELWTDRVGVDVVPAPVIALPDETGRVAGVRTASVLVESRTGLWLRLVVLRGGRWRSLRVADAPRDGTLGPAGLAANRSGRPVVSYSVRLRDTSTELWLVQEGARGRLTRTRVTKNGFPNSRVAPASAPVLMPNGTLRVVQTFSQRGANAIFWRREGQRWWGRILYASALGTSAFPFFTALNGENLYLLWSVAYPAQRELHVLLTSRTERSRSVVVHRNALAAGLLYGELGAEVAANENVAGLTAGLVLFPDIVNSSIQYSPPVELDGRIVAYVRSPRGRQLLLARNGRLEWFSPQELPHVRVIHETGLSGRIDGAAGGVVRIYRERAGEPRQLVTEVPVGADGRFAGADPAPVSGMRYRFVYEADLPYALLLRDPTP